MNEFVTVPPTVNNSELLNRIDLPEDPASQQTEEIRKEAAPKRIAFALGKESDPDVFFSSGTFV